jgi:hypothetical protein
MRVGIVLHWGAHLSQTRSLTPSHVFEGDYSRTKQLSLRAPTSIHSSVVCLIVRRSWCTVVALFRKHLAFLSFQISQATTANRESAPFFFSPCQRSRHRSHQSTRVPPPIWDASAPSTVRMFHQTCLEKEHDVMMWSMVSGS